MTRATKAHAPAHKSGYEMWQDGIDKADVDWDAYDGEIQSVVNAYNHHLAATPSYLPLAYMSVLDADTTIHEITVKRGDSIDKIAKTQGSTVEVMKKLNPTARVLHPGQVLKYQKAVIKRVITGWNAIHPASIAQRYNSGDSLYARKFEYAFSVISKRRAAACAQ